jgi:hypothetical protein
MEPVGQLLVPSCEEDPLKQNAGEPRVGVPVAVLLPFWATMPIVGAGVPVTGGLGVIMRTESDVRGIFGGVPEGVTTLLVVLME